jgi:two-component system chemotaxis response regulator CheB
MNAVQKLIVIGTSTGGISALQTVISGLPQAFSAGILITMHLSDHDSVLPSLLAPFSKLPVRFAENRETISPGTILIAPPGTHLLIDNGRINLLRGAKENYSRPAIDPFFRSAAIAYRRNTIGVILTGDLDDGTVGLQAIKACGGLTIVQDPAEAEAPSMPSSALQYVDPHFCLPLAHISNRLVRLVGQPAEGLPEVPAEVLPTALVAENQVCLAGGMASVEQLDAIAPRSPLSCPECHGNLWEMNAKPMRFRCHTGHSYTALTMRDCQDEVLEEAIWVVLRAMQEKKVLLKRLHQDAIESGNESTASDLQLSVDHLNSNAEILRGLVGT